MSEMRLMAGISDYSRARQEVANPGDYAEALATNALEALIHLFDDDENTIVIGELRYGAIGETPVEPVDR